MNYVEYWRYFERLKPIFEELQHLEPKQIARVLKDRGVLDAQGKVNWTAAMVEHIQRVIEYNKDCRDILEYRLPTLPGAVAEHSAAKKRRFEEEP